ncbi:MAG: YdeI/OmpD-associated family protein [Myxococcota bacterium]
MKDFAHVPIFSADDLDRWLEAHHAQRESVFLERLKKAEGEGYVPYEQVVRTCLRWGWIDSHVRKLDERRSLLLISPRRKGSPWSRANKTHIAALRKAKAIMPPGQAVIDRAKADGSWSVYDEVEDLVVPPDLAAALKRHKARANWDDFSPSSRKGILWWIKSAKRQATRERRVEDTAAKAAQGVKANGA